MTDRNIAPRALAVRFSRRGARSTITLTRSDGSTTGGTLQFSVAHDLLHFAIESELGCRRAFFGLIADGLSLGAFEVSGAAQALNLPPEAVVIEHLVGLMQAELNDGAPHGDLVIRLMHAAGAPAAPIAARLDDATLNRIRTHFCELRDRWMHVPDGGDLELQFDLSHDRSCAVVRHTDNPIGRFNGRASAYHDARPSVPTKIIDAVLQGIDRRRCTLVDLGAGTGLASNAFADALDGDSRVLAIEPNDEMRASRKPHPRVAWVAATAEQTGLLDAQADIVIASTAFHWFSPEAAPLEIARILRPAGRLAVFATDRDPHDAVAMEFHRVMGDTPEMITPGTIHAWCGHAFAHGRYSTPELVVAENLQTFDEARMIARGQSSSYWPGDPTRQSVAVAELRKILRTHAGSSGTLTLRYVTTALVASRL